MITAGQTVSLTITGPGPSFIDVLAVQGCNDLIVCVISIIRVGTLKIL